MITGCTLQHTHKAPGAANIRILGAGTDPSLFRREGRETTREGHITIVGNVFSDVMVNIEIHQARGVTISANTLWEGFEHDLLVEDSMNIVVTGNNFDRNPRYLVNGFNLAEQNGVVFRRTEDSAFTGNVVSGVRRHPAAVRFEGGKRLRVQDNSILDSDGEGITLRDVTDSIVTANLVQDGRKDRPGAAPGIIEQACTGNLVQGNLTSSPK
jgi:nitrous oxidase accessory protein NosD